jgi:ribosomal protein S18 acetylase RimI-like enzyme
MKRLRRAQPGEAGKIAAFQRAAYERNRAILGVEPIPLKADYTKILRDYEVWLYESEDKLAGVLILEMPLDGLLIWSVATAPDARQAGLGNRLLHPAVHRRIARQQYRLVSATRLCDRADRSDERSQDRSHDENNRGRVTWQDACKEKPRF